MAGLPVPLLVIPTKLLRPGNLLDFEVATQQAAALHHQHTVLHWLIQGVGEKHLHIQRLPHLSLLQRLQGGSMSQHASVWPCLLPCES